MEHIDMNNMVFNRCSDGTIQAGGFAIKNSALAQGKSAAVSIGENKNNNKKVSDLMSGYAVPAGIFYMHEHLDKNFKTEHSNEVIEPELFDKLLLLANPNNQQPNKKKTKKQKISNKSKTKKNRRK